MFLPSRKGALCLIKYAVFSVVIVHTFGLADITAATAATTTSSVRFFLFSFLILKSKYMFELILDFPFSFFLMVLVAHQDQCTIR